jgi:hypothetical protein
MADQSKVSENTHRYRNVIDDALDFLLAIISFVYMMFHEQLDITLSGEQLAMAATFGASARIALRKILMRLWKDGHASSHTVEEPSDDKASDKDDPSDDDAGADDNGDGEDGSAVLFRPPPITGS